MSLKRETKLHCGLLAGTASALKICIAVRFLHSYKLDLERPRLQKKNLHLLQPDAVYWPFGFLVCFSVDRPTTLFKHAIILLWVHNCCMNLSLCVFVVSITTLLSLYSLQFPIKLSFTIPKQLREKKKFSRRFIQIVFSWIKAAKSGFHALVPTNSNTTKQYEKIWQLNICFWQEGKEVLDQDP